MTTAQATRVTFTYRGADHPSINDATITITPGTVTLLCGASGSGKTTALRLFNGLIPHFHDGDLTGSVTVDDIDVARTDLPRLAHHCSTVFQNPRTQFYTTHVRQELAFGPENLGRDPHDIRRRIDEVAAELGIADLLESRVTQLSGGQMQRVACAVAMCNNTSLIVFDEPTANLSADLIDQLATLIARLKADRHTIIIAEHRLSFLSGIVDRVYCFDKGNIALTATGRIWAGDQKPHLRLPPRKHGSQHRPSALPGRENHRTVGPVRVRQINTGTYRLRTRKSQRCIHHTQ